jgi:uncharacterized membrane protein YkvA (DUF1232 family)
MGCKLRIVLQLETWRGSFVSKKSSLTSGGTGFFSELLQQGKLVFQLLLDPDVPIYLKALPFAAVAYLLFPFDFLPDVIPGLGQLDDITILLIGAKMFIDLAPQDVVAQYLDRFQDARDEVDSIDDHKGELQDEDDIIEGIIIETDDDAE